MAASSSGLASTWLRWRSRGYHGYVVAPGSTTSVGVYSIENDAPLRPLPESILSLLSKPRERQRNQVEASPDD